MIISILCFILILGIIVLVHEFGHFFFAKLFGVYVYEFAIGMGPKIFSWKKKNGETTYSLRLVPIGGFCQLAGEGADEDGKLLKERLLQSKPVWQRLLIMFFGAGNNFILAIITLFVLGLIFGSPSLSTVVDVAPSSPCEIAGMANGDEIIAINNKKVRDINDMQLYLTVSEGDTTFKVLRDNKEYEFVVKPLTGDEMEEKGYTYGISYNNTVKTGFFNSVKYSFVQFWSLLRQIALTLKELIIGGVSVGDLSGPVGIYKVVDDTRDASEGFGITVANLANLMALLCINVGFINLIPLPAFDGGRILFLIIEKIKGSPVKAETENMIHNIGFFILLGLIIFVTIHDILRLF